MNENYSYLTAWADKPCCIILDVNFVIYCSRRPGASDALICIAQLRFRYEMKTFLPLTVLLVMSGAIIDKSFMATNRTNHANFVFHSLQPTKLFTQALKQEHELSENFTSTVHFK